MRVEAGRQARFADRRIEPLPPSAQRFGIVRGIALALLPRQAMPLGDGAKAPLRNQQPAGKDIGLDEVGVARIAFKDRLVDRDELHRSLSAGPQPARDRSPTVGPTFLPPPFPHFYPPAPTTPPLTPPLKQ